MPTPIYQWFPGGPDWDAGAISAGSLTGDGWYRVRVARSSAGLVAGLNDQNLGQTYEEINYGFYFTNGSYQIVEGGVEQTSLSPFQSTHDFYVMRFNGSIYYMVGTGAGPYSHVDLPFAPPGGVVRVTPNAVQTTMFLDTAFYALGDTILEAERVDFSSSNIYNETLHPLYFDAIAYEDGWFAAGHHPLPALGMLAVVEDLTIVSHPLYLTAQAFADDITVVTQVLPSLDSHGWMDGLAPQVSYAVHTLPPLIAQAHEVAVLAEGVSHPLASALSGGTEEEGVYVYHPIRLGALASGVGTVLHNYFTAVLPTFAPYYSNNIALVQEEVRAADIIDRALALLVRDVLAATVLHRTVSHTSDILSDSLRAVDVARLAHPVALADQLTAGQSLSAVSVLSISDRLVTADPTTTYLHAVASVMLSLVVRDALGEATAEDILDGLLTSDAITARLRVITQTMEALLIADSAAAGLTVVMDIQDVLLAEDDVFTLGHYLALVNDALHSRIVLRWEGETYIGWVMNTEGSRPLSEYTGFPFTSFAEYGGKYYASADDGLYLLGGETDDGEAINASIKTFLHDFGTTRMKRVQSAYMGYTSDGDLLMKVLAVTGGELREHWFKAQPRTANAPRERLVNLGRGLQSRYWQFEIINIDGANFEIDKLELYPVILSRRV